MEKKYKGVMGLKTHICSYHLKPNKECVSWKEHEHKYKRNSGTKGIHGVRKDLLVEVIFEKTLEGEITISRRNV